MPSTAPVQFETYARVSSDSTALVRMGAEYPKDGPQPLTDSMMAFICHELDVASLEEDATEKVFKSLTEEWRELNANGPTANGPGMQLSYERNVSVLLDTLRYLTLTTSTDEFHGGAHGSHTFRGATFRKTDGRLLNSEFLFADTSQPEFQQLLKMGIRSYFSENGVSPVDDAALKELLIGVEDVNHLPLPQYPPYFTEEGVCFVYQQYEIAPYAAGLPTFTIPYNEMRPFLSEEARSLLD